MVSIPITTSPDYGNKKVIITVNQNILSDPASSIIIDITNAKSSIVSITNTANIKVAYTSYSIA